MNVEWNFFDRSAESLVTARNMPHIDMPGHLTFVTFRLADSMPRKVVERWHHAGRSGTANVFTETYIRSTYRANKKPIRSLQDE